MLVARRGVGCQPRSPPAHLPSSLPNSLSRRAPWFVVLPSVPTIVARTSSHATTPLLLTGPSTHAVELPPFEKRRDAYWPLFLSEHGTYWSVVVSSCLVDFFWPFQKHAPRTTETRGPRRQENEPNAAATAAAQRTRHTQPAEWRVEFTNAWDSQDSSL